MKRLRTQFSAWWKSAKATQRVLVPALAAVALVASIAVVIWSSRSDRELLFSGIAPEDLGPIVEELTLAGVGSHVVGGNEIWVDSSHVDEMRIRLAAKGLLGSRTLGYEILDRTGSGSSDFLQHVQYRRALEGELTRTIESLREVKSARVHLAIADPIASATSPTASVTVDLRAGVRLANDQVQGIRDLLSASVEGLDAQDVIVVDATGRPLGESSGELAKTFEQLRVQQEVEAHLRRKAAAMLEQVVGPSGAMVQITASLNFDRVEREVEVYNPMTSSLRSEQKTTAGASKDADETVLSQYEIDKTTERILGETGAIKRLSVAVLVNAVRSRNEAGATAYAERSLEELDKLAAIVRSAVGFSEERGDVLEIANLRFADVAEEASASALPRWLFFSSIETHLKNFILLLAIGLVAWGLRQSSIILARAIESDRRRRESAVAESKDVPIQGQRMREHMHELASKRPGEVASLLRGWLVDEKLP